MSTVKSAHKQYRENIEAVATGLAYSSALVALSAFAVGSFRPAGLSRPYVERVAWLRTDTFGTVCFIVATLAFGISEYFRLWRHSDRRSEAAGMPANGAPHLLTFAIARALWTAGTVLFVYVSVNAVTHPYTLGLHATHLLSWPTEGILRAVSLVVVGCSVAIERLQRIKRFEQDRRLSCPSGSLI